MQKTARNPWAIVPLILGGIFLFSFTGDKDRKTGEAFPYEKAGLTARDAAAHLLDRFTYGVTPGQVDEVVKMGLEKWFGQQLEVELPDTRINEMLSGYGSLTMSNEEVISAFPKKGQVLRRAIRDGVINKDSIRKKDKKSGYRKILAAYMDQHGYRPQKELYAELIGQKILRAAYTNNQVKELLTSFWFNHFNVSLTDNDCARFIMAYERDIIRPNALGNFESILLATAKSPAMLTYLDNFRSAAPDSTASSFDQKLNRTRAKQGQSKKINPAQKRRLAKGQRKRVRGLNENYAREIMELHTLGVEGGYTQRDVTGAAKIFTGWTIYPGLNGYRKVRMAPRRVAVTRNSRERFVRDGDFFFAANRHDKSEKMVLGTRFPANGGFEEGVKLIRLLAHHPATARFISQKLAVRFVSDDPPEALTEKMADTFLRTKGDIKEVLITLVSSDEFWSRDAVHAKTKSPFELAISAVRSLNADISDPRPLYLWISRMGERMYAYQAPTGFPDKGEYWINTGSLLARMNFGLALAAQRIRGITLDLPALHQNREPESAGNALVIYSQYLMPGRNLDETMKRLTPALHDHATLAHVVGIIIGSPEFQRK